MFIYLYSTVCLYNLNKSSDGVNRFCCSSSIFGRKPLSKASVCDILSPLVATGTGSLLSNECSLSKPASSWLSKPLRNLLMASSVSAASGQASKKSPSSGQGLPPSISSRAADGGLGGMSSASLCRPRKPVETGYTMYIHCMYMYIHGSYMYIVCTIHFMHVPLW